VLIVEPKAHGIITINTCRNPLVLKILSGGGGTEGKEARERMAIAENCTKEGSKRCSL